jgi:Pyridoxamine 5'-phosphate oxidase
VLATGELPWAELAEEEMMKWSDLASQQPRLADLGRQRLEKPGVVLVGTVRRDGTARISPVEPLFWKGDLWLSMLFGSHKAADLRQDPRVLVHSIVTGRDGALGEYKVRGRALEVHAGPLRDAYADEVRSRLGWEPTPGRFHLFSIDISDVTFIRYEQASGDQFVTRWPACDEFVRRGDGGTALRMPEPHQEILMRG